MHVKAGDTHAATLNPLWVYHHKEGWFVRQQEKMSIYTNKFHTQQWRQWDGLGSQGERRAPQTLGLLT
jgi:CCR4-NOT transcriptional regulation complex NOT5 subunit